MATGGAGPPGATFSVPLMPNGDIDENLLQGLCRCLVDDINILLQHFKNNDMPFVKPSDATTNTFGQENKMYICLSFEMHNLEELEAFRKYSEERPENKVSEVFGSFIKEKYDKTMMQDLDTQCPFNIHMSSYLYQEEKKTLEVFSQENPSENVVRDDNKACRPLAADIHEQSQVEKMFVIFPGYDAQQLVSVILQSDTKEYPMEKFNDVYLCRLTVPDSFGYKYKIKRKWISTRLGSMPRTVKSSRFKIKCGLIQRDFLHHTQNELEAHLCHIFVVFDEHCNKKELCSEIETVCTEDFKIEDKLKLITDLIGKTETLSIERLFPVAIVIGNIYKGEEIVSLTLQCDEAIHIADHLRTISLKDLTTSCCDYMPAVCHRLYQLAFPNKSSCVSEIMYFSDFFGDKIHLYFDICMGSKDCQMVADGDDVADFVGLCSEIGRCHVKFGYDKYSNHLKKLLKCASLSMIVEALKQDLENNIYDSLYSALHENMTEAIEVKRVEELYSCWRIIHQNEKAKEEFQSRIEEHVIEQLLNMTTIEEQTKALLLEENGLFSDAAIQGKLVKSLATSNRDDSRSLFMNLHRADKFKVAYDSLDVDSYIAYLEWIRTHSQSADVLLDDVVCIMGLTDGKKYVHDKVGEYLISRMKGNARELLELWKTHESKFSNYRQIEDAFIHIFREALNKDKGSPRELLQMMIGRGDTLQVKSSSAVQIIATILDVYCPLKEDKDDISNLSIIMQNIKVWHIIFTCTGGRQHDLYGDPTCVAANNFFSRIITMAEDESLTYAFTEKVLTFKDIDIQTLNKILQHMSASDTFSLKSITEKMIIRFNEQREMLNCVISVFKCILKNSRVNFSSSSIVDILSEKEEQLKCVPEMQLWTNTGSLYTLCSKLKTAIQSRVFWNVYNADTVKKVDEEIDTPNTSEVRDPNYLVQDVLNVGICKYRAAWEALCNSDNTTLTIANIKTMFENSSDDDSLEKEKALAEEILGISVGQPAVIIKRLRDSSEVELESRIVNQAVKAFGLDSDDFKNRFDVYKLWNSNDRDSKHFHAVQCGLKFLQDLKQDCPRKEILQEIGSAHSLISFLREIADEDIRNLIDAVDRISEQYVCESAVSGLIEVKSFLQPVIQERYEHAEEFLNAIVNRINIIGDRSKLMSLKINECKEHLHQLKTLYKNVANRGEQTKEIIKRILSEGRFTIKLSNETQDAYVTCICNGQDSTQGESILVDLRSRALLLMNSERTREDKVCSSEDLSKFVRYVDISLEIKRLVLDLFFTGHKDYFTFEITKHIDDLLDEKNKLGIHLQEWEDALHNSRENYYVLNFIQGIQLHYLFQNIATNKFEKKVNMLLKLIHSEISIEEWREQYDKLNPSHKTEASEFLDNLGESLERTVDGKRFCHQHIELSGNKARRNVQESVEKGRFLLAKLEENSGNVVKTVLALYENTTKCLPEPFQLLFCCKDTTWEEIYLLIKRCINSKEFFQEDILYCLANVELLPNETQFRLVEALHSLPKGGHYLLSVVCRGDKKHLFIDEFEDYVTTVLPCSDSRTEKIFRSKYPDVLTISSEIAGLGKSTFVKTSSCDMRENAVNVHISGHINKRVLIQRLNLLNLRNYQALHIDIADVDDIISLYTFLFELVFLRYVTTGTESYSLTNKSIYIEVANTINSRLRKSLQTAMCFNRKHLIWENFRNFVVSKEINSPTQVVCVYLDALEKNTLDDVDIILSNTGIHNSLATDRCRTLLAKYVALNEEFSFVTVHSFLRVLADQLKKLSCSSFFKASQIKDMTGKKTTIKSIMVLKFINVSKDFATRSIKACKETQLSAIRAAKAETNTKPITGITATDVSPIESMIRWQDSNHLIFVFHSQNIQTLTAMYRDKAEVPDDVKCLFESQMRKQLEDFNQMNQDKLQVILQKVSRPNPLMLKSDLLKKMSSDYALTPDNLLKMILIVMRIRARVPVVVMGETGCGKTSLIRYLARICEVPFDVMNIHAGTSLSEIVSKIEENDAAATSCLKKERWLFFDEINTSENLNLMSDVICHHTLNGKRLSPNLVICGACNPYKLKPEEATCTAGLKGKVKIDEMSKLVYRVLPLPQQLLDYVWDFGSLNPQDERAYINRMVYDVFPDDHHLHHILVDMLSMSQEFIRNVTESFNVSLRDVQRCKMLTKWFCKTLKTKGKLHYTSKFDDDKIPAIILAISHCYISRLTSHKEREELRNKMEHVLKCHKIKKSIKNNDIQDVIVEEQRDLLHRMELPPGIAHNQALQENVFMILMCILNRIPIFVVGKPGCSKSLAMQVIRSNLRGKDSKDEFFKTLPQIYCVSFQGSESSTSDGILEVFKKSERYQQHNQNEDVMSVVLLDEIGLAEVSPFNPLKVLHSLLEPGDSHFPNIAVVGISNWALDASKMNRAIHLSRPDMNSEELYNTGVSISQSFKNNGLGQKKQDDPRQLLKAIADAYSEYSRNLVFENFHGLRDYYAMVKYVAKAINFSSQGDCERYIVQRGLARNFGGLPSEKSKLYNAFKLKIEEYMSSEERELYGMPEVIDFTVDQMPIEEIISENLKDCDSRHLLLITSGQSVFGILERLLLKCGNSKYEVIFGSQFEEDLTDDYNYRMLSRIILCMEEGGILILKDLDTIYGSLYDMLNQNYTIIGKNKNCRVALGHYSNPICRVADTFRCIVLVDQAKLDYQDPPFLNRFEKQMIRFNDILGHCQEKVVLEIQGWIERLSDIGDDRFCEFDLFPIYSRDLLASLVLKIDSGDQEYDYEKIVNLCKSELFWIMNCDAVLRLSKITDNEEAESVKASYFENPIHAGLSEFYKWDHQNFEADNVMRIIFTYTRVHTHIFRHFRDGEIQIENIGAFKSEKQLSTRMKQFWLESDASLLCMQCSVKDDGRHVVLIMAIVERYRKEFIEKNPTERKHVYLILHMNRRKETSLAVSHISFLSSWHLVTLDSLEGSMLKLVDVIGTSLIERLASMRPLNNRIVQQMFWVYTRIKYSFSGRSIGSIHLIIDKIKSSEFFLQMIDDILWSIITSSEPDSTDWQLQVACDRQMLLTTTGMVDALETYLHNQIRTPLAKVIYRLEELGALESFFVDDCDAVTRRNLWLNLLHEQRVFNIQNIPIESGPECYNCNASDLSFRTPFFKHIYDSIEGTKDEFMTKLFMLKESLDCEEYDSAMIERVISSQQESVSRHLPNISPEYPNLTFDYVNDFCNILSASYVGVSVKDRIQIAQQLMRQTVLINFDKFLESAIKIHAAVWLNPNFYSLAMQVLELCSGLIPLPFSSSSEEIIYSKDDSVSFSSPGTFADAICEKLLPSLTNIDYFPDVTTWSEVTGQVLPMARVLSDENPFVDMLCYCHAIYERLLQPFEMKMELLYKLADEFITSKSFAEKSAFQCVMNIVNSATEAPTSVLQRAISDYLMKCVCNHPSANCLTLLYNIILEQKLPDKTCAFMKNLVASAIESESDDIENKYAQSFFQVILSEHREIVASSPEQRETVASRPFIKSLNDLLKDLSLQDRLSDPFVLLLIDIFEKQYSEYFWKLGPEKSVDIFLTAHSIIRQGLKPNLTYTASVACYKAFLVVGVKQINEKAYSDALNTIFVQGAEHEEIMFFFNCLRGKYTSRRFFDVLQRLQTSIPSLEKVPLTADFFTNCFDNSPLDNIVRDFDCAKMSQKEDDKTLIEKSTTCEGLLAVYHVILKDFYIPRGHGVLDDVRKRRAEFLLECAKERNSSDIKLMSCMLGRSDFLVADFMLTPESESRLCLITTTLCTLYSLLMSSLVGNDAHSIFQTCLVEPFKIAKLFLPAFPGNIERSNKESAAFISCTCGYRICVISPNDGMECLICKRTIGCQDLSQTENILLGCGWSEEMNRYDYSQRCLSPVACNMLLFLLKGCLLGSYAVEISTMDQLVSIPYISEDYIEGLFDEVKKHWTNMLMLLNIEDFNLFLWLQTVIQNNRSLFDSGTNPLDSSEQRNTWEETFSEAVNDMTSHSFDKIVKTFTDHAKRNNLLRHEFEMHIGETDEPKKDRTLSAYCRMAGEPSRENFIAELFLHAGQFPILDHIMKRDNDIEMVKSVYAIIQWHLVVVTRTSYLFKKQELLDMTVRQFIDSRRVKHKESLTKRFNVLVESWKHMPSLPLPTSFRQIQWTSKMSECLILDKHSQLFRGLQFLIKIQNDIIEEVMCKAPDCKSLHQFRKSDNQVVVPEVPVMQITRKMLIGFEVDIGEATLQEAQCDHRYGKGRQMIYDFEEIEKAVIANVVTGKVYIQLDFSVLPRVVFSDELYRNISILIHDIRQNIKQEHLNSDMERTVIKEHANDPKMIPELLEHIGLLLPLLKMRKTDPECTVKEYVEELGMFLTTEFPLHLLPSESMKLCYIISLYEFLEELNADAVMEGLETDYRTDLGETELAHFKDVVNKKCQHAAILLKTLKRFLHRSLSNRDAALDASLISYISDALLWPDGTFSEGNIVIGIDQCAVTDLLPEGILVEHICCVLDTMKKELETRREVNIMRQGILNEKSHPDKDEQMKRDERRRKLKLKSKKKY